MKLKPLHDWAVIRPSAADERTAGGLHIPDTAKQKPEQGVVESIGPGAYEQEKYGKKKKEQKERKFIPTTVKPGDHVLFERYAGQTYDTGAEELILVRERDILGLLPEGLSGRGLRRAPRRIPRCHVFAGTNGDRQDRPKGYCGKAGGEGCEEGGPRVCRTCSETCCEGPEGISEKSGDKARGRGARGRGPR